MNDIVLFKENEGVENLQSVVSNLLSVESCEAIGSQVLVQVVLKQLKDKAIVVSEVKLI